MDVRVYSEFVLFCVGSALRRADPPSKESYRLYKIKNLSETKRFTDVLCSKWEKREWMDEWVRGWVDGINGRIDR
jgi:hypothetical protein